MNADLSWRRMSDLALTTYRQFRGYSRVEERCQAPRVLSLPNNLDHDSLAAATVELAVEDLLPGAEVEISIGYGDNHLSTHDLAFVVGVGVVLARSVVMIPVRAGIERRQPFQPPLVVFVEPTFIVVDEHARGDVHCIHEAETFLHTAGSHFVAYFLCDVDERSPLRYVELEVLGM